VEILLSLLSSFVPLVVLGLIIWAIVSLVRRGREEQVEDPGIGTVRRLFIYGGSLGGAFMGASGLALLVGGLVDLIGPGDIVIGEEDTTLALALSLTIVGAPVWGLFWWAGERSVRDHPVERRSLTRRAYANVVRAASLVVVLVASIGVVSMLLGIEDFNGEPWGWALVWSGLWLIHDRRRRAEPAPSDETRLLDRLYLYFGSVLGLAVMAPALGGVVYAALRSAYDAAFVDSAVAGETVWEDMRSALALFVVAAPVWYWHWARHALRDAETALWRTYLFLFGVLGGVVAALVGTGGALYLVLAQVLDATDEGAAEHFEVLPGFATAVIVGAAVWGYHRVTQRELAPALAERSEPERVYCYLISAAGLATLATGLVTVFVLAVEALTPDADVVRESGWWREWLAAALTFLLMGAPLWLWYWSDVQRHVRRAPATERPAPSRRVFIFAVAGVSVLTATINLVMVLFQILQGLLEGQLTQNEIYDARWNIAFVLTTGAIGVYYWLVLREDRSSIALLGPAVAPTRRKLVFLVAPARVSSDLAPRLERFGDRVTRWQRLDLEAGGTPFSDDEVAALHDRIDSFDAERVMVLVNEDGTVDVVPFAAV
jgi:hypothetical protein